MSTDKADEYLPIVKINHSTQAILIAFCVKHYPIVV